MKIRLWQLFIITSSCVGLCSCVIEAKCYGASCVDPINFQLIDKITRQNLVSETAPRYKRDSLQLNKNINFNIGIDANYLSPVSRYADGLQISTGNRAIDTSYLRLSYNDIDTLIIQFRLEDRKCCDHVGGYGNIVSIKYNGQPVIKNGDYYLFEK